MPPGLDDDAGYKQADRSSPPCHFYQLMILDGAVLNLELIMAEKWWCDWIAFDLLDDACKWNWHHGWAWKICRQHQWSSGRILSIDVTRVRFPAGALQVLPLFAVLLYLTGSSPLWCWHWGQLFIHFYASDSYCAPKPVGGPRVKFLCARLCRSSCGHFRS